MEGLLVAKVAQDAGRGPWGRPPGKGQAWGFSGWILFLTLSPAGQAFIYTGSTQLFVHAAL